MKHSVPAFLILLLACGCGKVGDLRPPKIRIPANIADLKVTQNETNVTLTWTNPQRYSDGSMATDLTKVRILQNGNLLDTVPVSGPGKPQSHTPVVVGASGSNAIYSIEVETERGKRSAGSNEASIVIVDVPGVVLNLGGAMDQHRIRLEWAPPAQSPSLAEIYIVRREDGGILPAKVTETFWEDTSVEAGVTYRYVVTAARNTVPPVLGHPSSPLPVVAKDGKPPAKPTGLQTPAVSDSGAILRWDPNTEEDWAGYRVYRSDNPNGGWVSLSDALIKSTQTTDEAYRPGTYYSVSAVDESGNEGEQSSPVRAP